MPHALYIVVIKTSARDAPGCWITEGAPGAAMQVALKATHLLGIHRTGLAIRHSSLAPRRAWPRRLLPHRPLMYSSLSQCRGQPSPSPRLLPRHDLPAVLVGMGESCNAFIADL